MAAVPMSNRRGSLIRLVVVVALSIATLAADHYNIPILREVRAGAATVAAPAEGVLGAVTRPFRNAWHGVTDYDEVVDENSAMADELAQHDAAEIANDDASRRLEELSAMLDLPWTGDIEGSTARVVSGARSNYSHSLSIDKGRSAGIKVGMPVIAGDGLVGRITQAGPNNARVDLLTGPDLQVGVRLAGTGAMGTLRGQGRHEPLLVDAALPPDAEVEEGAGLVTSGLRRSVFPEAIPVAKVIETRQGPGGLSLELLAEPLVDPQQLSYVTVLLWEPPE